MINKKSLKRPSLSALACCVFLSGHAVSSNADTAIQFIDAFGRLLGPGHLEQYAIRHYPTPNQFYSEFKRVDGLADANCMSFASTKSPGKYLMADSKLTSHPELLSVNDPDTDLAAATFCEEDGTIFTKKKSDYGYKYQLTRWDSRALNIKYRGDDKLVLSVFDIIKNNPNFLPASFKEVVPSRFTDRFFISASRSQFASGETGFLSELDGEVIFQVQNFDSDIDSRPETSNWVFLEVKNGNFVIQHSESQKYLASSGTQLSLIDYSDTYTHPPETQYDYNVIKDEALWSLNNVSTQGEYLIFNKSLDSKYVLALGEQNGDNFKPVLAKYEQQKIQANMLFNITEHFSHLRLLSKDISAQNSIVRLHNGLARLGIYPQKINWKERSQKIIIEDHLSSNKYRFAAHAGAVPEEEKWSYDREQTEDISLKDLISRLPALKEKSEEFKDEVYNSVKAQLTNVYNAVTSKSIEKDAGYTPSILWFAPESNIPDQLSETDIQESGKVIRVISRKAEEPNEIPAYGFLLQRTNKQGVETFTIFDPDDITGDER